jgi:hypothetical protein
MIIPAQSQPVPEIVVEGKPELLAGLHQTEHDIACDTAVAAHRAAGDFPFGDKGSQGILRCVGVQRNFGIIEHLQQLGFPSMQPLKQLVERIITGALREDPVEPSSERWS